MPDMGEDRSVHAAAAATGGAAGVVRVELEERLLESGGLDREVVDPVPGDRGEERPDITFEPAAQPPVAESRRPRRRRHVEIGRRAAKPHLDVPLAAGEKASGCPRARRAGPRRTIATRSQTRSTSDSTCEEKKIVLPARRRSSRSA